MHCDPFLQALPTPLRTCQKMDTVNEHVFLSFVIKVFWVAKLESYFGGTEADKDNHNQNQFLTC